MTIPNGLEWAHQLTAKAMAAGPRLAIDATVGNGHDTLHLAKSAQPDGCVRGFDIQKSAVENTRKRIAGEGLSAGVELFNRCHSKMRDVIPDEDAGRLSAIMFNLGYLPEGDASIVTKAETTIAALEASLRLLRTGGVITVMIYPGHPGSEADDVLSWATGLDQKNTVALRYDFPNQKNHAPWLLGLERRR